MLQVNAGLALPKENTPFEVMIRIADREIIVPVVANSGTFIRYNYKTAPNAPEEFKAPYLSLWDMGVVFVYLRQNFKLSGW